MIAQYAGTGDWRFTRGRRSGHEDDLPAIRAVGTAHDNPEVEARYLITAIFTDRRSGSRSATAGIGAAGSSATPSDLST